MAQVARTSRRWALALSVAALAVTPATAAPQGSIEPQPLVSTTQGPGNPNRAQAPSHGVRPLGQEAQRLLADARRLSPTVRHLLAELDASDLIVYVEYQIPRPIRTGQLALVGSAGGVRYVRIEIFGVSYVQSNIPWLAHELQHAIEIASSPEVTDATAFNRLYRRIGYRSGAHSFETDAAIVIGNQVLAELRCPR